MGSTGSAVVNVGSWIGRRARVTPEHPALIDGDRTVTYAELAERIRRLAGGLHGLGVARGDRIAWIGPNHAAFLESFFAAGTLGAVLAPVNHRLGPDERAVVLGDIQPTVLIEHAAQPTTPPASVRHRLIVGAGERPDGIDYEGIVAGSSDDERESPVTADDLLFLPHTSGTTGVPKGVMLTHGNVTWNVVNVLSRCDFRASDVTVAVAPFFRVGGTGVNVLPMLFLGGTVILPDDITGDGLLGVIERQRVTVGFGNPDVLDGLLQARLWPVADLSGIRFILTGGAPVPERLIRAYRERGVALVQGYGLSEAGPLVLLLDDEGALRKIGSAGRPPLFVDIRIVDQEGRDVAPGQTGELRARGPNVMAGYWRRPAETAEALVDGRWLRTGDAARIDDDGDVWIVDRVSAGFVAGDRLVYPGDVERELMAHPAVADAGVGPIESTAGAAIAAAVVVRPGLAVTAADIIEFARRRLATHQLPESITFVDQLPRNSVGKLVRADLRTLLS